MTVSQKLDSSPKLIPLSSKQLIAYHLLRMVRPNSPTSHSTDSRPPNKSVYDTLMKPHDLFVAIAWAISVLVVANTVLTIFGTAKMG